MQKIEKLCLDKIPLVQLIDFYSRNEQFFNELKFIPMNSPIVNDTFRFVKWLYAEFLPIGYRDFQLDLAVELKNSCTSCGLQRGLSDQELEILSIAALLHNIGCIEGQYHDRTVAKTIAHSFLAEKGLLEWKIEKVEYAIEATAEESTPKGQLAALIRQLKFKQAARIAAYKRFQTQQIGDVFP